MSNIIIKNIELSQLRNLNFIIHGNIKNSKITLAQNIISNLYFERENIYVVTENYDIGLYLRFVNKNNIMNKCDANISSLLNKLSYKIVITDFKLDLKNQLEFELYNSLYITNITFHYPIPPEDVDSADNGYQGRFSVYGETILNLCTNYWFFQKVNTDIELKNIYEKYFYFIEFELFNKIYREFVNDYRCLVVDDCINTDLESIFIYEHDYELDSICTKLFANKNFDISFHFNV